MKNILKLDNNSYLKIIIPDEPQFLPDDIEIWLITNDEKECIFHDSFSYSVLVDVKTVFEDFQNGKLQKPNAQALFAPQYAKMIQSNALTHNLDKHLLFTRQKYMLWLSTDTHHDAILEFAKVDIEEDPITYTKSCLFSIDCDEFCRWMEQLLSFDRRSDLLLERIRLMNCI